MTFVISTLTGLSPNVTTFKRSVVLCTALCDGFNQCSEGSCIAFDNQSTCFWNSALPKLFAAHRLCMAPAKLAAALDVFETPNGDNADRSVSDITWSCLAVIFSCTWVAIHPNVPSIDVRNSPWRMKTRRLLLMLWAILVPELMVMWAVRQWVDAGAAVSYQYASKPRMDGSAKWTRTHGFFLIMGGYSLVKDGKEVGRLHLPDDESQGIMTDPSTLSAGHNGVQATALHPRPPSIAAYTQWPDPTEAEIQDKSKGDALAKLLVIGQGAWFVLQLLARFALRLAVTELEVMTLAYAAVSAILYLFWWYKPLDVQLPISIPVTKRHPTQPSWHSERPFRFQYAFVWGQVIFRLHAIIVEEPAQLVDNPLVSIHLARAPKGTRRSLLLSGVAGTLFGAIHCIAWQFHFPSTTERILWKVASILVTTVPLLWYILMFVNVFLAKFKVGNHARVPWRLIVVLESSVRYAGMLIIPLILYSYFIARLILIVESFVLLRDLSPDAFFVISWTKFIPHI